MVLSACNSGVAGNGKLAVTPADYLASTGVKTIIASYWCVDDAATAILMSEFYKRLSTMTKIGALNGAMQELRKDKRYSHPYYWSAFYLVGYPR